MRLILGLIEFTFARAVFLTTTLVFCVLSKLPLASASLSDQSNKSAFQFPLDRPPFTSVNNINKQQQQQQQQQQPEQTMRAWTCHGKNQREMVDRLRQARIIQSPAVHNIMKQVDRVHYAPPNSSPYQDAPQVLGWGQTISAPHMHAAALEEMYPYLMHQHLAHPTEPLKILDVGCGSGYLTACLGRFFQHHNSNNSPAAEFASPGGTVFGIDIHPELVDMATKNMRKADADLLDNGIVHMKVANGWNGLKEEGPFDAIHVGASAESFPRELAVQLKPGGVLVVPIGPQAGMQYLYRIERRFEEKDSQKYNPNDYDITKLLGVRYVPLVHGPVNN